MRLSCFTISIKQPDLRIGERDQRGEELPRPFGGNSSTGAKVYEVRSGFAAQDAHVVLVIFHRRCFTTCVFFIWSSHKGANSCRAGKRGKPTPPIHFPLSFRAEGRSSTNDWSPHPPSHSPMPAIGVDPEIFDKRYSTYRKSPYFGWWRMFYFGPC